MKTKNLFLLSALITALNLLSAGQVRGQIFTTLHSFASNAIALRPNAGLVMSSNTLYGTTFGTDDDTGQGYGTVFAVGTQAAGFTNLQNMAGGSLGVLIALGNTLYGTSIGGSQPGFGSCNVFAVATNGAGFTNLHTFSPLSSYGPFVNADGTQPRAGLALSENTLYGTAFYGGSSGNGTVFAVKTDGTGFTNLHSFTSPYFYTNSDGANPQGGVIVSGGKIYGTTTSGGGSGNGTVFAMNTNGTGFSTLHSFTATSGPYPPTNSDGATPQARLVISGNTLFGTTYGGGTSGNGTVFAVHTDVGTGFTNLHHFTSLDPTNYSNGDGACPQAALILAGATLYGTALGGGSSNRGTMFAIRTDGTGFTNLHSFTGGSDGSLPMGELIVSGNTVFGTAAYGGNSGYGMVFSLSFPPRLTIIRSGANVILSWPTNVAGFDSAGYTLQSTPSLTPPVTWSNVSAASSGYVAPKAGTSHYFRLALPQ